jgi:HdeA/HdeB family
VGHFYRENDGFWKKSAYDGSNAMNGKPAAVLLLGLLAACVQTQPPEAAAPPAPSPPTAQPQAAAPAETPAAEPVGRTVYIQRARCEDLLGLSPDDRAAASMFYIGYQASRLQAASINVGTIPSIEEQAISYCQEHPNRTVVQAFANAYSRARRR